MARMTRWSARRLLWALPLLPLAATPVQAGSITLYGSIIITSLGNDGIMIQFPDQQTPTPGDEPMPPPADPAGDPAVVDPPVADLSVPGTGATGNPDAVGGDVPTDTPPGSPGTDTPPPAPTDPMPTEPMPTEPMPEEPPPVDVPVDEPIPPPGEPPLPGEELPPVVTDTPGVENAPEPASLTLLAIAGLGGLGYARRRRNG
jgi:hypothetical protein